MNDHNAPWNLETDDDGVTRCYCSVCNAARARLATEDRQIDDYEFGRFSRCK